MMTQEAKSVAFYCQRCSGRGVVPAPRTGAWEAKEVCPECHGTGQRQRAERELEGGGE